MSSQILKKAVGIPYLAINCLEKALEPSISAAAAVGPKIARPRLLKTSTIPVTRVASGPTTVKAIDSFSAKSATASKSVKGSATHSARFFIPGLPGQTKILSTLGLCASFQTSACSLPPPPITKIRITFPPNNVIYLPPIVFPNKQ
ncbi:hypothetical protein SDC9_142385 [bioreactor metagenome]|uniref:Uncharacterized protein n=1 Tax=bioreactor metagenome TaxID=1076179 RepID=A0A645E111_9ZZZZ